MKPNIFQSLRMKMVLCAFMSAISTVVVDIIIVFFIYVIKKSQVFEEIFYKTTSPIMDNATEPVKKFAGIFKGVDNEFITIRPTPFLTNHFVIDVIMLLVVTLTLFMMFYVLFSHNIITYFRDINKGVERIRNGDLETDIKIKGNDEISILAISINNMRLELKQSIEKERELERTKNELITNVAHDLRTPLTSMIGYLDLIKRNENLEYDTKEKYLNIAYDKSKRLEGLVIDLFDYTRYEKNKIQVELKRIDLTRFVEQLAEEFYPSAKDNNLNMINSFPKNSIYISGDGELLARAFGNLVGNAIKYGADGKQIKLSLFEKQDKAIFVVTNYGKIISAKDIENIFQQFYRGDASRTTIGAGLGLAIAKNIIDMHNGEIHVTSGEEGTVFRVIIDKYKD